MCFQINSSDILEGKLAFVCGDNEYSGVKKVAGYVCDDMEKVFSARPNVVNSKVAKSIVVATINVSDILGDVVIDVSDIEGKRECFKMCQSADGCTLYIIGSDKRGTIYGLFHLSELLGVSPFVDWLDVMPAKKDVFNLHDADMITSKEPSVRFRGFFINDEWPAFGNWTLHHFDGINAKCYEQIFKVLLRMKGNYLWPAMWTGRFAVDGPGLLSADLADELGVVMGMSHHEPCLRHGEEYKYLRGKDSIYGDAWDFRSNREGITRFWEDGLKRNGMYENVITVGMRGEFDSTILGENATLQDNIDLLRDVLVCQNQLIKKYVNEDLDKMYSNPTNWYYMQKVSNAIRYNAAAATNRFLEILLYRQPSLLPSVIPSQYVQGADRHRYNHFLGRGKSLLPFQYHDKALLLLKDHDLIMDKPWHKNHKGLLR